jgi:hypothetical protein
MASRASPSSQPVEVHVCAAQDRDDAAVSGPTGGPGLQARNRQRTGRLHDASRVVEDVLDGRADLVVADPDDLIHRPPGQGERVHPHLAHRDPIREDADLVQQHPASGGQRLVHRVGLERLDADDLDVRTQCLDIAGNAGDQSAPANGDEHGRQIARALAQEFVANRPLSGDDERVVERMNQRRPGLAPQDLALLPGLGVAVAMQEYVGSKQPHGLHLDFRRRLRHDDQGSDAQPLGRKRDTLRVVARTGCDHAASPFFVGQMGNTVVGAAQFEAEDGLQILALEQHWPSEAC